MSPVRSNKTIGYTIVVCLLGLPGLGTTENSPPDRDFNKRWYGGGGVGFSSLKPKPTGDALSIANDQDTSLSLHGGLDLSPHFSVDAYASRLGSADVEFLGTPIGGVDYTVYGASLIGYFYNAGSPYNDRYDDDGLYLREGLSTYARIGIGKLQNSSDDVTYEQNHGTHLALGLGLEYGWPNGFAVRSEYTTYDIDAKQFNLSLIKRFGDSGPNKPIPPIAVTTIVEPKPTPKVLTPVFDTPIVHFAFDKFDVRANYIDRLDKLIDTMSRYPDINLQIDGHTDSRGPEDYNITLGQNRANEVSEYLVSNGVSKDRLSIMSYGESKPTADNLTDEGRALNRRVEIYVQK